MQLKVMILAGMLGLGLFYPKDTTDTKYETKPIIRAEVLGAESRAEPVTLQIPSINLDAQVDSVGLGSDGLMVVPEDNNRVSWFEPRSAPGEIGTAVFAGHNQWLNSEGVFADLKKIKNGDLIKTRYRKGDIREFVVTRIDVYKTEEFPVEEVYNDNIGRKVKLITCHGVYDKGKQTFDQRLVVTAELTTDSDI